MIRNPRFSIVNIEDNEYLVPSGQEIVDRHGSMRIGGLSRVLWDILEKEYTVKELFRLIEKKYDAVTEDDTNTVANDVSFTISAFLKINAVTEEPITVYTRLVEAADLWIDRTDTGYSCHFPTFSTIDDIEIVKSRRYDIHSFEKEYELRSLLELPYEKMVSSRIPYSYYSLDFGRIFIHSVSVLYRDRLWLISAPSGTGKTTHASMWVEYEGARIVNGDLNLIGVEAESVYAYGTPWCGTSMTYDLERYPVGGVIFLRQGYDNHVDDMSTEQGILSLVSRDISPMWDNELVARNVAIAKDIASHIMMCKLYCTKDKSAFDTLKEYIDGYLDGEN